ncbi:hypothetical protein CVT26_008849 [Gymnopilus dilepis]|uniref:Uncharacterized protein n=1 Tax=Gymnopilus dilepis TaxID=231916 RepID=A0A409YGH3_9AGAR|nr:hypothetical protein CVT26_008849 [Gymnopilus dilepis]
MDEDKNPAIKTEDQSTEQSSAPPAKTDVGDKADKQVSKKPRTQDSSDTETASTGDGSQEDRDTEDPPEHAPKHAEPSPPVKAEVDKNAKKKGNRKART